MIRFFCYSFLIAAALCVYSSCKHAPAGTTPFTDCDTVNFKQKGSLSAHYHFCYPKKWKTLPPNGMFDEYVGTSFQDSASQYKKIFALKLENTSNGSSAMGNFAQYIDSSRKQINMYITNLRMRTDKDTVWNNFSAHIFEFTGTIFNRPFWTSQFIIDGAKRNYFYVLNFQQRLDDPDEAEYDMKTKNDIFNSFALTSESEH